MAAPRKPAPARPRKRRPKSAVSAEVSNSTASSTRWLAAGVIVLFLASSAVSFFGLLPIGGWLGLSAEWSVAVPISVDLAIFVYKFAEIKLRQDPRKEHLAWKAKVGVIAGSTVSSAGNVLHVISLQDPDPVRFWGGMLFAGLAPWGIYLAAAVLTDIIVKPKPKRAPVVPPAPPAPVFSDEDMTALRLIIERVNERTNAPEKVTP